MWLWLCKVDVNKIYICIFDFCVNEIFSVIWFLFKKKKYIGFMVVEIFESFWYFLFDLWEFVFN